MTQQATKWLVPVPAHDPYGKETFKAVCRGNADLGDILGYFVFAASREAEYLKLEAVPESITITRTLDKIVEYLKVSKKTVIARIQKLVEWKFLTSHAYHHRYDVHITQITQGIQNPPAIERPKLRGRHAVKSTIPTILTISEGNEGKDGKDLPDCRINRLEEEIVNLQSQIVDLTGQIVNLQSLQSSKGNAQARRDPFFDPLILPLDYPTITFKGGTDGDAALADHPHAAPVQSLQWENFSAFDEGIPSEVGNDTESQLSTSSVDNVAKGQNDDLVAPVVPVAVPDRLPDCGADVAKTDVRGDDHANVAGTGALQPLHAAARAGTGESSEPESIADTLSQETAVDSLPPPDPVASPLSVDVVPPAAGVSQQPTSEGRPSSGRKRKPPKEKPAKPVDIPLEATLSEDEMLLYREWCSLFHVPVRLTASIAKSAKFLAEPLTIWAGLLGVERVEVLRGYKRWEFSCNNRNGFFSRKGVQLYDLERDFEAWQSAMQ